MTPDTRDRYTHHALIILTAVLVWLVMAGAVENREPSVTVVEVTPWWEMLPPGCSTSDFTQSGRMEAFCPEILSGVPRVRADSIPDLSREEFIK